MFARIKIWAAAAGAVLLAVLYSLFKNERRKRKEAETQVKIHKKREEITEYMEEAEESESVREAAEIERKAEITRNANDSDLDDYINSKL